MAEQVPRKGRWRTDILLKNIFTSRWTKGIWGHASGEMGYDLKSISAQTLHWICSLSDAVDRGWLESSKKKKKSSKWNSKGNKLWYLLIHPPYSSFRFPSPSPRTSICLCCLPSVVTQIIINIGSESFSFLELRFCNCLVTVISEGGNTERCPVNCSSSRNFPDYPTM